MGSDELFKKARAQRQLKRKTGNRGNPRDRILIVCEGVKSEPNYFKGFRLTNVTIEGKGYNTDSLVNYAIEQKKRAIKDDEPYDQVWCVFDRDSFTPQNFNNALALAQQNNIEVAYSNEAFELWYLLHFHYYDTGISRTQYIKKLDQLLSHKYKKNSPEMYAELLDKQPIAIQNATKLLTKYPNPTPIHDNPSTKVHLLVMELNKWVK